MKKIIITLLLVFSCGLSFPLDTIFGVERGNIEILNVEINTPEKVANSRATNEQNGRAWYYRQEQIVSTRNKVKYDGFTRISVPVTEILKFNGVKNVIYKQYGIAKFSFAWEIIIAAMISFVAMSLLQMVISKSFIETRTFIIILLSISIVTTPLFLNPFFTAVSSLFWLLFSSCFIAFSLYNNKGRLRKKRNIFVFLFLALSSLIVLILFPNYWEVLISSSLGIVVGIPTICYWKHLRFKRIISRKNLRNFS